MKLWEEGILPATTTASAATAAAKELSVPP
jgi:hypothetical protein